MRWRHPRRAPVRRRPEAQGAVDTFYHYGEKVLVFEEAGGHAWCQSLFDGYVGYVEARHIAIGAVPAPTHFVMTLGSYSYEAPDLRSAAIDFLPRHSAVVAAETGFVTRGTEYARLDTGGFLPLACLAALESPSTGIVDGHAFMLGLRGDAEDCGAAIAFRSPLLAGHVRQGAIELEVGGEEPMRLLAHAVVNSAGLFAQDVARSIEGFPAERIPPTHYCKGNYFSLSGRSPFSRLVYPAPEAAGLGVHLTLDLAGQARFGPDVEWIERVDYDVDPKRAEVFYGAIRSYWPGLKDGALQPAYSGIRPKLQARGQPASDFLIQGPADHGIAGLVNLFGIESPGLTASLAIGDAVSDLLGG